MNTMTELYLISLTNLVLCSISGFIMLCRMNTMRSRKTRPIVQWEYAVGVGVMIASVCRPWWGEWPGYASLMVASWILLALIASAPAWRTANGEDKAPPTTDSGYQPPIV